MSKKHLIWQNIQTGEQWGLWSYGTKEDEGRNIFTKMG